VPSLPDLPTLQEQGLKGFEVSIRHALYAPKGTPQPVVDTPVKAWQASLKNPTVNERFADLGTEPVPADKATPAYLEKFLAAEINEWGPIIQKAGQYAD
jgi:tripartite-type tricarboxylate transporter receptor subunit TctC